jgi:hypothetical protein
VLGVRLDGSDAATLRLELPRLAHVAAGQYYLVAGCPPYSSGRWTRAISSTCTDPWALSRGAKPTEARS